MTVWTWGVTGGGEGGTGGRGEAVEQDERGCWHRSVESNRNGWGWMSRGRGREIGKGTGATAEKDERGCWHKSVDLKLWTLDKPCNRHVILGNVLVACVVWSKLEVCLVEHLLHTPKPLNPVVLPGSRVRVGEVGEGEGGE